MIKRVVKNAENALKDVKDGNDINGRWFWIVWHTRKLYLSTGKNGRQKSNLYKQ